MLPKSAIGVAVRYAINQWTPLMAYVSDGRPPMHNNDAERDLRRLTIGRKSWLFFGSAVGGEVAAILYTIISSAHRRHLDLWAYLNDVLRRLAAAATDSVLSDMEQLLPDHWAKAHPESIRQYRQAESLARSTKKKQRRDKRRNKRD